MNQSGKQANNFAAGGVWQGLLRMFGVGYWQVSVANAIAIVQNSNMDLVNRVPDMAPAVTIKSARWRV